MTQYVPKEIEEKWQKRWADARVAEVDVTAPGEKFYMLNMFPYPSGDLHVVDGRCERCGSVVEQRELEQWFLKITDYADRLDAGLDTLVDWPERVKLMQRNWIGRSVGADVEFPVPPLGGSIRIFTTRPDTIYGATFMVLAPEHPDVPALIADALDRVEIERWIEGVRCQSALERQEA